jgi:hypothetical protein
MGRADAVTVAVTVACAGSDDARLAVAGAALEREAAVEDVDVQPAASKVGMTPRASDDMARRLNDLIGRFRAWWSLCRPVRHRYGSRSARDAKTSVDGSRPAVSRAPGASPGYVRAVRPFGSATDQYAMCPPPTIRPGVGSPGAPRH